MGEILKLIEYNQYNFPALVQIIVLYLVFVYLGIVAWVYRDITTRYSNVFSVIIFTLFVGIGNLPALIIYLLVRSEKTIEEDKNNNLFYSSVLDRKISGCPNCNVLVRVDYHYCPECSFKLDNNCPACDRSTNPTWTYCAHCNYRLTPLPTRIRFLAWSGKQLFNIKKLTTNVTAQIFSGALIGKLASQRVKLKLPWKQVSESKLIKINTTDTSLKIIGNQDLNTQEEPINMVNEKRRGRPKGIKDLKPRPKRSDAGKNRGQYKKSNI